MCLAIPGKIVEVDDARLARVDILGAQRSASLDLVPQAQVGDYVLVHAGFAIEVVDEQIAQETLELIRQFPELVAEDELPSAAGGQAGQAAIAGEGDQAAPASPQSVFAALAQEEL